MIIYRFRPDMVFDCEIEVPDGTTAIPRFHTFQAPHEQDGYYAIMQGGWRLIQGEKPPYPPIPTLEEVKNQRLQDLAARRWEAEVSGTTINGMRILTDRDTQSKLTAAYAKATQDSAYIIESWKFAPGVFVTLTSDVIISVANAVERHIQLCFINEANISSEIMAAETKEEINEIDIDKGWPE